MCSYQPRAGNTSAANWFIMYLASGAGGWGLRGAWEQDAGFSLVCYGIVICTYIRLVSALIFLFFGKNGQKSNFSSYTTM